MIVLLLTSCVTLGIGLATKTFDSTYKYTKAQTLASTLDYLISNELRTATYAENGADGLLVYRTEKDYRGKYTGAGEKSGCVKMKVSADGHIYIDTGDTEDKYNNQKNKETDENYYTLGTPNLYGEKLQVKDFSVSITENRDKFVVSYTIVDKDHQNDPLVTSQFEVNSIGD